MDESCFKESFSQLLLVSPSRCPGAYVPIWKQSGPHADTWLNGIAMIPVTTNETYTVVVRHIHSVKGGFRGDVAIDDFNFYNCSPSMLCVSVLDVSVLPNIEFFV